MKSSNVSNSASVSPGKPTMNVVRKAMPGMPARSADDQDLDVRARGLATHPAEHRFVDVLQRHVDVARDLVASAIVSISSSLQCAGCV